ncbi:MAG: hypothetical protein IPJ07_19250 [Acidobacteria bacterium]|nr:hypothetical protein [Acidobacteriota bacterium]
MMNSIGWLGAATAPPVIALASQKYGMSACLSANSMIYLFFGILMVVGIFFFMNKAKSDLVSQ